MWTYFIDATEELIRTEGYQQITIRKVAEKAGYNSATIYNYFGELSHLLFFASLKFLKPYIETVTLEMKNTNDPIEKYLVAWEVFSNHSFKNPEVFHAAFLMDLGEHPESLLLHYYELYPADLLDVSEELKPALMERSIDERGRHAISHIIQAGLLNEAQAEELNELTNLIWQGMFTNVLNNRNRYSAKEAHERTIKYIREIIFSKLEIA